MAWKLDWDGKQKAPLLCECGGSLCPDRIYFTWAEYERTSPALSPWHGSGECRYRRERGDADGRDGG